MEEIRSALLEILEGLHPDEDFETATDLVDAKVIDSFDIITIISEINDEFDVTVTADYIVPENFNSLDVLCELVQKLIDED